MSVDGDEQSVAGSDRTASVVESIEISQRSNNLSISKFTNLDSWRDGPKRYLLKQLIRPIKGKIDEKMKLAHASDAVVWNLIHIHDSEVMFPTYSPPEDSQYEAMVWLKDFRSDMVKVMMKRARLKYYEAICNQPEYESIKENNKNFVSYKDLEKRTLHEDSELVRKNIYVMFDCYDEYIHTFTFIHLTKLSHFCVCVRTHSIGNSSSMSMRITMILWIS